MPARRTVSPSPVAVSERDPESLKRRVDEVSRALSRIPFLSGVAVPIRVSAGNVSEVAHRLGRVPSGFFFMSLIHPAGGGVTSVVGLDGMRIRVHSSVDVSGKVWVF